MLLKLIKLFIFNDFSFAADRVCDRHRKQVKRQGATCCWRLVCQYLCLKCKLRCEEGTRQLNKASRLREGIEEILPTEAHSLATDRLYVSITHSESGTNHSVSTFTSREELIKVLLASCFVPVYAGLKPVELRGKKWIDGGFTDSLPILPLGRTITVSPFAGRQDVCPIHRGRFKTQLSLANMNIMLSVENLKRLNQALFPPSTGAMRSLCEEGFTDAVRFLKREGWMG
uniref:PNPLA domain-containing protein n=1 Tax=Astatotilapia calliptera TaxID=8154 RepID=A0AAX7SRM5_ASTCA